MRRSPALRRFTLTLAAVQRLNDAVPVKKSKPTASRTRMPKGYGVPRAMKGTLPWRWAEERLARSHNYLISTVRPDNRPHVMVVWCIWLDNACYFSTSAESRKAINLASNPQCVICNDDAAEAVIVEGTAQRLSVEQIPPKAFDIYLKKYGWKLDPEMGPVFKVTPHVVFAMPEKTFPTGVTRWTFEK
jgi:nitroimidazol reductase NimA-like FMN-containing flavoprotein (pyridoxamine 5'-phosphate oxidase superfamily)